jgi:L-alanine-DL-glutamate epimerase-like enolase superfamily enzyme
MRRSSFIKNVSLAGIGMQLMPAMFSAMPANSVVPSFLPEASTPVLIKWVKLMKWKKNYFVTVTSAEGQMGITACNARMEHLAGIFNGLVAPFFIDKNAWDVGRLAEDVYKDERNYKYSGMPFWNCVGHIEVATWDLLGKIVNKPVHQLLGKQKRQSLPMYLSSLTRDNTAEAEVDKILPALAATGCKAVKIKVGGRMGNDATAEKRSKELINLLRKKADSQLTVYADANSSFNVKEGIAMGKFLEDNGVDIFEEPCPWEDFESNKKVKQALKKILVAGGEQDTSYYRFEWYCKNNGLDVLQPDTFYNGGIARSLKVAALCKQYGKHFAPHSPKADPLEAPFLHLMAVAPNVYGFQEFPLSGVGKKQERWWEPHYQLKNGMLAVPDTPGLGIAYDTEITLQGELIK